MRRLFIAGNWKMHLTRGRSVELAGAIAKHLGGGGAVDAAVCPPSVYLDAVVSAAKGSAVGVGAQNCYHEPQGAFTGEISVAMLADIGCKYVILGHSERRHILGESNQAVNKKVVAVLKGGLIPIVCVGETLAQREAGQTFDIVAEQFFGSLAGVSAADMSKVVIAYEPVWAIGTGKTATSAQAQEVHADLRKVIAGRYNAEVASQVRIQYGGSVKPDNAQELLSQPDIDGALVGGASLKPADFIAILEGGVKSGKK